MADVLKWMGLMNHKVAVGTGVFLFEMLHQTALADCRHENVNENWVDSRQIGNFASFSLQNLHV
jgi:hypothetical protein